MYTALTDGGTIAAVTTLVLESELDNVPNPTLVRIRGHVWNRAGAIMSGLEDSILIAHAIMVVDAKQLAVGTTALPLPLSSNSEDFLWADSAVLTNSSSTSGGINDNHRLQDIVVDSKAMRKITLNQVLVMVSEMELLQGSGGEDVDFALQLRMLFKK